MKIILGKDYYDNAGMGFDEEIVFLRKEKTVQASFLPHNMSPHGDSRRINHFLKDSLGMVIVAGHAYPWIRLPEKIDITNMNIGKGLYSFWSLTKPGAKEAFFHSEEKAMAHALNLFETFKKEHKDRFYCNEKSLISAIKNHFAQINQKEVMRWAIENRAVTAWVTPEKRNNKNRYKMTVGVEIIINGAFLKDCALWLVLPPAEAHQMISGFIGGVLPGSERSMVTLGNNDRIIKAGFDSVTSFRKMAR